MNYIFYKFIRGFSFFRIYEWPAVTALLLITYTQILNVLTVIGLISYFQETELLPLFNSVMGRFLSAIAFYSFMMLLNYLFLFKKKDSIMEKYAAEEGATKKVGTMISFLYLALSVGLYIFVNVI